MRNSRDITVDEYTCTCHHLAQERGLVERVESANLGRGVLSPAEAADLLGISLRTLRTHVRAGNVACVRLGFGERRPRRGYLPDDLVAFIARLRRIECPTEGTHRTRRVDAVSVVTTFTQRRTGARRGLARGRSR